MSPLQIRIMLHYSYSAVKWDEDSSAAKGAIDGFVINGMLNSKAGLPPAYSITDKGKAYVKKLCSIPIPVETTTYTFPVEGEE